MNRTMRATVTEKPFAGPAARNTAPILEVLRREFAGFRDILEIGSGTAQHAVAFAAAMPHLRWQTSDLAQNHGGINALLATARFDNVFAPLALDVREPSPVAPASFDAVFAANTAHIMSIGTVKAMFSLVGDVLRGEGVFCLYGAFNYRGEYTSESNARFDRWLRARDPSSGIRDFEALDELARRAGMTLAKDYEMPANNRMLVWRRLG